MKVIMNHARQCLAMLLMFPFVVTLTAQDDSCQHTLQIQLVNETNTAIPQAELFIEQFHLLALTDATGFATFRNLCTDSVELDIWFQDYHEHHTLGTDQQHTIRITFPDMQTLSELHIQQHQIGVHTDHLHLQSVSLSGGSSISQKLANIPMVRLQQTGNSIQKPILQGLTGLRLPLFQDGMRLQGQAWGSDHAPELGRIGAEDITIYKGADALTHAADGWGNTIEIHYRPTFHAYENHLELIQAFQTNANQASFGFQFTHGGKKEANGMYLSAQFQQAGDYRIPAGYLPNTAFQELSFYSGLSHQFRRATYKMDASYFSFLGGIFLGSHIGNLTDLNLAIQSKAPLLLSNHAKRSIARPFQEAQHTRISIERLPKSSKGLQMKVGFQRNQRKEFDPHRNPQNTFPQLNLWVNSLQSNIQQELQIGKLPLIWGLQHEFRSQDWGGFFLAPTYQGNDAAVFLKLPLKLEKSEHAISARYDAIWRNTQIKNDVLFENFAGFSAAYSGSWINRKQKNEIHVAIGRRAPSVNERYSSGVHHGSASFEVGNANIGMETGFKIEWEHQQRHSNFSWRTNVYGLHAPNFIHLNPQTTPILSVRGAFPHYKYEALPTTYVGFNAWATQYFSNGNLEFQADILWGRIWQPVRYPTQFPPPSVTIKWQHNIGNILFEWQQLFVAEMPFFTPSTDLVPPPAGYALSNVVVKPASLGNKHKVQLEFGIYNIWNTTYREYLDRFRYFTPQMGRNIQVQLTVQLHHHRNHERH